MSHDLTLPGAIPRLLRRCSPTRCRHTGRVGVVVLICSDGPWVAYMESVGDGENVAGDDPRWEDVALDLRDSTGSNHAGKWSLQQPGWGRLTQSEKDVCHDAIWGRPGLGLARLRDICLRLAGLEASDG